MGVCSVTCQICQTITIMFGWKSEEHNRSSDEYEAVLHELYIHI
jgi:hypothetical protein